MFIKLNAAYVYINYFSYYYNSNLIPRVLRFLKCEHAFFIGDGVKFQKKKEKMKEKNLALLGTDSVKKKGFIKIRNNVICS